MTSRIRMWQTVAVVVSFAGLFTACGYGGGGRNYVPPPPLAAEILIAPMELQFNAVAGAASGVETITLTNVSGEPAKLPPVRISLWRHNAAPTPFYQENDCGPELAKDAHCTIKVVYLPLKAGTDGDTVSVQVGDSQWRNVQLSGVATQKEH